MRCLNQRKRRMNARQNSDREESEVLMSQGKTNGFSVQLSEGRDITLLKQGRSVAWFSAAVSAEMVKAIASLIASCEKASQQ